MSLTARATDVGYHSAVQQLSKETQKLRSLRELHALKVANQSLKEEVERVKARVEQSQREVMELLLRVERFTGDYDTLQEKIRTVRKAVEKPKEPVIELESAA